MYGVAAGYGAVSRRTPHAATVAAPHVPANRPIQTIMQGESCLERFAHLFSRVRATRENENTFSIHRARRPPTPQDSIPTQRIEIARLQLQ